MACANCESERTSGDGDPTVSSSPKGTKPGGSVALLPSQFGTAVPASDFQDSGQDLPSKARSLPSRSTPVAPILQSFLRTFLAQQTAEVDAFLERYAVHSTTRLAFFAANGASPALALAEDDPKKKWKWKSDFCVSDAGYTLCVWHVGETEYWMSITDHLRGQVIDLNKALAAKLAEGLGAGGLTAVAVAAMFPGAKAPAGTVAAILLLSAGAVKFADWCCGVEIIVLPVPAGALPKTPLLLPILNC